MRNYIDLMQLRISLQASETKLRFTYLNRINSKKSRLLAYSSKIHATAPAGVNRPSVWVAGMGQPGEGAFSR